jgi:uncharacterized protein (DUF1810 family)
VSTDRLQRFHDAQRGVYERALAELRSGRKRTHWMWFIFPQVAGLGVSTTSEFYALAGRADARAYLDDPILGARLRECAETVLATPARSARDIFDYPDDLKMRSSATLFALVEPEGSVFHRILERYFDGIPDPRTVSIAASET